MKKTGAGSAAPVPLPPGTETILDVTCKDVVMGRGSGTQNHCGNVTYRKLVLLNKELYATSSKFDKLKISKAIVAAIRHNGGRFLQNDDKRGNGAYIEIGDKRAWDKTSQALREGQSDVRARLAEEEARIQEENKLKQSVSSVDTLPAGASKVEQYKQIISEQSFFTYSKMLLESLFKGSETCASGPQCPNAKRRITLNKAGMDFLEVVKQEEQNQKEMKQGKSPQQQQQQQRIQDEYFQQREQQQYQTQQQHQGLYQQQQHQGQYQQQLQYGDQYEQQPPYGNQYQQPLQQPQQSQQPLPQSVLSYPVHSLDQTEPTHVSSYPMPSQSMNQYSMQQQQNYRQNNQSPQAFDMGGRCYPTNPNTDAPSPHPSMAPYDLTNSVQNSQGGQYDSFEPLPFDKPPNPVSGDGTYYAKISQNCDSFNDKYKNPHQFNANDNNLSSEENADNWNPLPFERSAAIKRPNPVARDTSGATVNSLRELLGCIDVLMEKPEERISLDSNLTEAVKQHIDKESRALSQIDSKFAFEDLVFDEDSLAIDHEEQEPAATRAQTPRLSDLSCLSKKDDMSLMNMSLLTISDPSEADGTPGRTRSSSSSGRKMGFPIRRTLVQKYEAGIPTVIGQRNNSNRGNFEEANISMMSIDDGGSLRRLMDDIEHPDNLTLASLNNIEIDEHIDEHIDDLQNSRSMGFPMRPSIVKKYDAGLPSVIGQKTEEGPTPRISTISTMTISEDSVMRSERDFMKKAGNVSNPIGSNESMKPENFPVSGISLEDLINDKTGS